MTFDNPDCYLREEQIWNKVFDNGRKVLRFQIKNKSTPTIKIIELSKDTEESFTFPDGVVSFSIRDRGNSRMLYSYKSGEFTKPLGEFIERGPYSVYMESGLNAQDGLTIYFQSNKDDRKIEIIYWT